jgi:phosphoglycolate phosphatase
MLDDFGYPQQSLAHVRQWVGNGAPKLIHRALTGDQGGQADTETHHRALESFLGYYHEGIYRSSAPYPNVLSTLDRLQKHGIRMACVTNKPTQHSQALLKAAGIEHYFAALVCGDTLPERKPDPKPLQYACKLLSMPADAVLMVGDSLNDLLAAKSADMAVFCVSYGYHQNVDLASYNPDAIFDDFSALLCWLDLDALT